MLPGAKRWLLLALVAAFAVSWFSDKFNNYYLGVAIDAGINVILAVSLNLINGHTGQFSLGHAPLVGPIPEFVILVDVDATAIVRPAIRFIVGHDSLLMAGPVGRFLRRVLFVRGHGGEIILKNRPGGGLEVRIVLPRLTARKEYGEARIDDQGRIPHI